MSLHDKYCPVRCIAILSVQLRSKFRPILLFYANANLHMFHSADFG